MTSQLKPWLLLLLIFVLGVATGSTLTATLTTSFMQPVGPQQMRTHWMLSLTRRLTLTPEQQGKIQPIVADAENKIQALHRDEVERVSQIIEKAHSEISELLTPAQQAELQKMEAERLKLFLSHMHPHGGPGGPHGGPDGTHERRDPPGPGMQPPPAPPPGQTNAPGPAPTP